MNKDIDRDTTIPVCEKMWLEIKEKRMSSTMFSPKDGYEEVSRNTRTCFCWKLHGIASKFSPKEMELEDYDKNEQVAYDITISSQGFDMDFISFNTREGAIRNALEFASKNGIKVDGYCSS
jgi:hypothetical protein